MESNFIDNNDINSNWSFRILGCRNLNKSAEYSSSSGKYLLQCKLFFNGKRLQTNQVSGARSISFDDCQCDWTNLPPLNDWFQLPKYIQVCLIGIDFAGCSTLLGSAWIDWRKALLLPQLVDSATSEKTADIVHANSRNTIGTLVYDLQASPELSLNVKNQLWKQCARCETFHSDVLQTFKTYTSNWWQDYVQAQRLQSHQHIQIYAVNEVGTEEPVTNWIRPFHSEHIPTPLHALRFVSLLDAPVLDAVGTVENQVWKSTASVMASLKATYVERAIVLANALLGFGFKVFVFLGKDKALANSAGVLTIDPIDGVTWIWDAEKGRRLESPFRTTRFYSVDCLFNHTEFLANLQPSNVVTDMSFDINSSKLWKPLKRSAIEACRKASLHNEYGKRTLKLVKNVPPVLPYSCGDLLELEKRLETDISDLIVQYRANNGIPTTRFDVKLSHLLASISTDLETAHIYSYQTRAPNTMFQQQADIMTHALHGYLPPKHSFVAHRLSCRNTINPGRIFAMLINQSDVKRKPLISSKESARDLLLCRAERARFGFKAKVDLYAEGLSSVWIVFAVTFKNL